MDAYARLQERIEELGLLAAHGTSDPKFLSAILNRRAAFRIACQLIQQDSGDLVPLPTPDDHAWATERLAETAEARPVEAAAPAPSPAPVPAAHAATTLATPRVTARYWNPERLALAERLFTENTPARDIVRACDRIPAVDAIADPQRIYAIANRLGWKRQPAPPVEAATPEPTPEPAPELQPEPEPEPEDLPVPSASYADPIAALKAEAMDMFVAGMGARAVADELGIAASQAAEWADEHRATRKQKAA